MNTYIISNSWTKQGNGDVLVKTFMRLCEAETSEEAVGKYIKDAHESEELEGYSVSVHPIYITIPDMELISKEYMVDEEATAMVATALEEAKALEEDENGTEET